MFVILKLLDSYILSAKKLPISTEDVRKVCSLCRKSAELKPRLYKMEERNLITAI